MNEVKIYPKEIADGVSNLVKANNSIAYTSPIVNNLHDKFMDRLIEAFRSNMSTKANRNIDRIDLYPIQTVLVTTGWNKNTDIFTKQETWNARYSAQDKPFNYQHQQAHIIGHITDNFVIDDQSNLISMDASINDVPDKFHIVTPAVIYRAWENPDKKEQIEKIIAEIEKGDKWFVSMECLFSDFDYGLNNSNGESRIIARNEQTAGLTKFLRQYGGTGIIDGGYTIGRVLKNILFSGKGLVDNPANPESIIFDKVQTFKSVSESLGYIDLDCPNVNKDKGKSIMADDTKAIATNIEDNAAFKLVKAENDKLTKALEDANKKLAETNTQAFTTEIASLKDKVSSLESELTTAKKSVTDLTSENKSLADKNTSLETEITTAKKNQLAVERTSSLIALGASEEEAKSIVAKFENVSAEQFTSMVELVKDKWAKSGNDAEKKTEEEFKKASKSAKNDDEDDKMMDKDCKAEKVVETAKAEEDPPLGVTNINQLESTKADINNWWKSVVDKKKKS